jgi:hypothetical protein
MPRPPEMMILAEVSSGRSDFRKLLADEGETAGIGGGAIFSTRREPVASAALNAAVRTVMTFLLFGDLHGLNRVAGIDRPLEGIGRDDLAGFRKSASHPVAPPRAA